MRGSLPQRMAEEFSVGGVNQSMGLQDFGERRKLAARGEEKPASRGLAPARTEVFEGFAQPLPGAAPRARFAAVQILAGAVEVQSLRRVIGLRRAVDIGIGDLDSPPIEYDG